VSRRALLGLIGVTGGADVLAPGDATAAQPAQIPADQMRMQPVAWLTAKRVWL